jgi:hypothetical protein
MIPAMVRTRQHAPPGGTRADFVSEPIIPVGGSFDAARSAIGEPALPMAFRWREQTLRMQRVELAWKASVPEASPTRGERYLRRHYYRLRMEDGSAWTIYFLRHTPRSGNPRLRWFLYERLPVLTPLFRPM